MSSREGPVRRRLHGRAATHERRPYCTTSGARPGWGGDRCPHLAEDTTGILGRVWAKDLQRCRNACSKPRNACSVSATPALIENAALRKAAFPPEPGVMRTPAAFAGTPAAFQQDLQRFNKTCSVSHQPDPVPGVPARIGRAAAPVGKLSPRTPP